MRRKRYVYTRNGQPCEPYEVTEESVEPVRLELMTGNCYEGVKATDGTDISSRAKRQEYMRRHNLADADDFKGTWQKAAQERAKHFTGEAQKAERREAVERAMYRLRKP